MEIMITDYDSALKLFFRFLKENRSYKQYIHNLTSQRKILLNGFSKEQLFSLVKSHGSPIKLNLLISRAFTWDGTLEGEKYWRDLHSKWIRYFLGMCSDECSFSDGILLRWEEPIKIIDVTKIDTN